MSARPRNRKIPPPPGKNDEKMVQQIADLEAFQEFKASLLPAIRADLRKGTPSKEILEKAKSLAAARLAQIVMTETDSARAMVAIKDLLDRTDGKAKETVVNEHRFKNLKGNQLDALIKTKLAGINSESKDDGEDSSH